MDRTADIWEGVSKIQKNCRRRLWMVLLGVIHKPHLLRGGGRGGGQKLPISFSKKTTKEEGGGHKI